MTQGRGFARPGSWTLLALASTLAAAFGACAGPRSHEAVDAAAEPDAGSQTFIVDDLPAMFPRLYVPPDQPLTPERATLGRHLFYDPRLSLNQSQSCASCHEQARAFSDGRTTSIGSTGEAHFRNAPSLANVGFRSMLTWANPTQTSLSEQALLPMFGEAPVELGLAGHENEMLERLRSDPRYVTLFASAFPDEVDPISLHAVVVSIAAFERTILSFRSPYDRYVYEGASSALSASAKRGLALFFDERFECFHCHGGFDFTDSNVTVASALGEIAFHNTGLYNVDGVGSYPAVDRGIMGVTNLNADMGRFRTASLRNVELTAPYFHDGSAATLDDVLDHYAHGGRLIASGPNAGNGATNVFKSELVQGFVATPTERADLLAFLRSLTDTALTTDPRLSNPWPGGAP